MRERIISIIKQTLKISSETEVKDETKPGDLQEWDSLGHMMLMSELEKQLHIKFEYDDILAMDSVGNIVKVIVDKYSR